MDTSVFSFRYLPLGGQRSSDREERVQSSLCAPLSTLQDLLIAVTNPVLTTNRCTNKWLNT